MKFIDQEDTKKLHNIGSKIQQMKLLNQEILDFFIKNDEPLYEIKRKLNPVIGETGKIDIAAIFEKEKDKTFIYQVYDLIV